MTRLRCIAHDWRQNLLAMIVSSHGVRCLVLWLPVFILMMTSTPSQEVIGEIALGRLVSLVILLDDFRQVGHTNAPTTPKGIQSSYIMEAAVTFV